MKTEEITIGNALWWDKRMLISEITKPDLQRGPLCAACVLKALEDPTTNYYSDAPLLAITEYLHDKQCDIDGPFKVVMKVRTIEGKGFMYNVLISEINFATKDMVDLQCHLARPTALKLIRQAAQELKFEEIEYVSAYVEEV